tara:strand:- start:84 stop:446 length:363 start_codon:yes stop_codon:yes gene_type:complete
MKKDEINKCLKEQLGDAQIEKKEVAESKLFILDGIMAGDLPVYRKWLWKSSINPDELKWLFRIDVVQGRLQVDRIKFEDKGRVEFDTRNHGIILDSDFSEATEDEWRNGVHKLMKYIRNE